MLTHFQWKDCKFVECASSKPWLLNPAEAAHIVQALIQRHCIISNVFPSTIFKPNLIFQYFCFFSLHSATSFSFLAVSRNLPNSSSGTLRRSDRRNSSCRMSGLLSTMAQTCTLIQVAFNSSPFRTRPARDNTWRTLDWWPWHVRMLLTIGR